MNISKNIINRIIEVLSNINFYLCGEDFCICAKCNCRFIGLKNEEIFCFCENCQGKLKRIDKICNYEVSIEPPDYGSYTNGRKGFTLFVTVHNKSTKQISVKLKEFTVFSNNRQWSPSYSLTGYTFDIEEHIMSQSSKTLGKIWCEDYWQEKKIVTGDYVTFSIIIRNKTYSWKFIMNENEFELDDYYVFN